MTEATLSVTAAVERIGPEEAKTLLGLNTHNRVIRQERVHTMARDMNHGKWQLNGETIKVGDGSLIDGQHRLLAVIEANATVEMFVVRGLPDDARDTVDTGRKRDLADRLQLAGEENSHNLAAAIRLAWFLDNFNRPQVTGVKPSNQELVVWLNEHPDIRQSISVGRHAHVSVVRYPPSIATTLHYLMARVNHQMAGDFWDAVSNGGEPLDHPTHVLREALLHDLVQPHRMHPYHRAALTIKAWNFVRDFKTIKAIGFRSTGPGAEDFPKIK